VVLSQAHGEILPLPLHLPISNFVIR